jgi:hypothetical protein
MPMSIFLISPRFAIEEVSRPCLYRQPIRQYEALGSLEQATPLAQPENRRSSTAMPLDGLGYSLFVALGSSVLTVNIAPVIIP